MRELPVKKVWGLGANGQVRIKRHLVLHLLWQNLREKSHGPTWRMCTHRGGIGGVDPNLVRGATIGASFFDVRSREYMGERIAILRRLAFPFSAPSTGSGYMA
jgi:hypothetical protein